LNAVHHFRIPRPRNTLSWSDSLPQATYGIELEDVEARLTQLELSAVQHKRGWRTKTTNMSDAGTLR
jgi:hypothetical protein